MHHNDIKCHIQPTGTIVSIAKLDAFVLKVTGQLADTPTPGLPTRRLDISRTGQLADWTTRGLADAAKRTKTKHANSPVASASCPVRDLSSMRVV